MGLECHKFTTDLHSISIDVGDGDFMDSRVDRLRAVWYVCGQHTSTVPSARP